MITNIITLYMQIFCIITFASYLIYVLAVVPLYKSLPFKAIKKTHFISIELMIILSSGVLLSSIISHFAVSSFNMSKLSAYISYLFLFIFLFILYIAAVFKPYY